MNEQVYDKIGYWSEIKLDIIRDYAKAYSGILHAQRSLMHMYIDAFAGGGLHISKTSGGYVPGSPQNALLKQSHDGISWRGCCRPDRSREVRRDHVGFTLALV